MRSVHLRCPPHKRTSSPPSTSDHQTTAHLFLSLPSYYSVISFFFKKKKTLPSLFLSAILTLHSTAKLQTSYQTESHQPNKRSHVPKTNAPTTFSTHLFLFADANAAGDVTELSELGPLNSYPKTKHTFWKEKEEEEEEEEMKVAVEVVDAADLMPKDRQGSANPFVMVDFDGQRHRTQTKIKDLSPFWNEKFLFNVSDPSHLPHQTIDVSVYYDRSSPSEGSGSHDHDRHRHFLGRVRISGASVAISPADAPVQRFPLEKRGLFSHIRGDIGLRVYLVPDSSDPFPAPAAAIPPFSMPTPDPAVDGEKGSQKNKEGEGSDGMRGSAAEQCRGGGG